MNEELLQRLYKDLEVEGRGVSYEDFIGAANSTDFMEGLHKQAKLTYGFDAVPDYEGFTKAIGIAPTQSIQQQQQAEQNQGNDFTTVQIPTGGLTAPISYTKPTEELNKAERYGMASQHSMGEAFAGFNTWWENSRLQNAQEELQRLDGMTDQEFEEYKSKATNLGKWNMVNGNTEETLEEARARLTTSAFANFRGALDSAEEAERYGSLVQTLTGDVPGSVTDINSIGDFGNFAAWSIAQALPQMAAGMSTFGLASFAIEAGIIQNEQMKILREQGYTDEEIFEKALTDPDWAAGAGLVAGALDFFALGTMAKMTGLNKVGTAMIRDASKRATKEALKKTGIKTIASKRNQILKGLGKGMGIEGVTEAMQGNIEQAGATGINISGETYGGARMEDGSQAKEYDFSWEETLTEGLAGALAGGFFGGGGSAISASSQPNYTKEEREEINARRENVAKTIAEVTEGTDVDAKKVAALLDESGENLAESVGEVDPEVAQSLAGEEGTLLALADEVMGITKKNIATAQEKETIAAEKQAKAEEIAVKKEARTAKEEQGIKQNAKLTLKTNTGKKTQFTMRDGKWQYQKKDKDGNLKVDKDGKPIMAEATEKRQAKLDELYLEKRKPKTNEQTEEQGKPSTEQKGKQTETKQTENKEGTKNVVTEPQKDDTKEEGSKPTKRRPRGKGKTTQGRKAGKKGGKSNQQTSPQKETQAEETKQEVTPPKPAKPPTKRELAKKAKKEKIQKANDKLAENKKQELKINSSNPPTIKRGGTYERHTYTRENGTEITIKYKRNKDGSLSKRGASVVKDTQRTEDAMSVNKAKPQAVPVTEPASKPEEKPKARKRRKGAGRKATPVAKRLVTSRTLEPGENNNAKEVVAALKEGKTKDETTGKKKRIKLEGEMLTDVRALIKADKMAEERGEKILSPEDRKFLEALTKDEALRKRYNEGNPIKRFLNKIYPKAKVYEKNDLKYQAKQAKNEAEAKEVSNKVLAQTDSYSKQESPTNRESRKLLSFINGALDAIARVDANEGFKTITNKLLNARDKIENNLVANYSNSDLAAKAAINNSLGEKARTEQARREKEPKAKRTTKFEALSEEEKTKFVAKKYRNLKKQYLDTIARELKEYYAIRRRLANPKGKIDRRAAQERMALIDARIKGYTEKFQSFMERPDSRNRFNQSAVPLKGAKALDGKIETLEKAERARIKEQVKNMSASAAYGASKMKMPKKLTEKETKAKEKDSALMESERIRREEERIRKDVNSTTQQLQNVMSPAEKEGVIAARVKASEEHGKGLQYSLHGTPEGEAFLVIYKIEKIAGKETKVVVSNGRVGRQGGIGGVNIGTKGTNLIGGVPEAIQKIQNFKPDDSATTAAQEMSRMPAKKKETGKQIATWKNQDKEGSGVNLKQEKQYKEVLEKITKMLAKHGITLSVHRVENLKTLNKKGEYDNVGGVAIPLKNEKDMMILINDNTKNPNISEELLTFHEMVHIIQYTSQVLEKNGITGGVFNSLKNEVEAVHRKLSMSMLDAIREAKKGKDAKLSPQQANLLEAMETYLSVPDHLLKATLTAKQRKEFKVKNKAQVAEKMAALENQLKAIITGTKWEGTQSSPFYGFNNLAEFMAEGVANPYFMNMLRSVESTKQLGSRKLKSNLMKDLVNRIVKFTNKLLGKGMSKAFSINAMTNNLYAELNLAVDEAVFEMENDEMLVATLEGFQSLQDLANIEDTVGKEENKVKAERIDKVSTHLTNVLGLGATKKDSDAFIENLNKQLPEDAKFNKSMATRVWNEVKAKLKEGRAGQLQKLLNTKTVGKNAKNLKIGKGVSLETAKVLDTLRGGLKIISSEKGSMKAYERYQELESQLASEGTLSEKEMVEMLMSMVGGYRHLNPETQAMVNKSIDQIIKKGKAEFLEAKVAHMNKVKKLQDAVFNTLMANDYKGAVPYMLRNRYAEYNKGDLVVFNNRIHEITEDKVKGNEITNKNSKVKQDFTPASGAAAKMPTKFSWQSLNDQIFALDDVMEILSSKSALTNKQYRSELATMFTAPLRQAGVQEFLGINFNTKVINEGRARTLGDGDPKKGNKVFKKLHKKVDQKEIDALLAKYPGLPIGKGTTRSELLLRWMQGYALDTQRAYEREKGINAKELQQDLDRILTAQEKRYGKFQIAFYNRMYDRINPVYRSVYGTDLDKIDNYVPVQSSKQVEKADHKMDLVSNMLAPFEGGQPKQVGSAHFLQRTGSIPASANSEDVLLSFVNKMEHFIAFAEPLAKLNAFTSNSDIKAMVHNKFPKRGNKYMKMMDEQVKTIARGTLRQPVEGTANKDLSRWIERIRANAVVSSLALNFTLLPKQLVSFPAYLVNIDWTSKEMPQYLGYTAKLMTPAGIKDAIDIFSNAGFIKMRAQRGHTRDVALVLGNRTMNKIAAKKTMIEKMAALRDALADKGMLPTKIGDIGAIVLGGYGLYKIRYNQNRKQGMSKEESKKAALYEVQRASEMSQQSSQLMDLGSVQTGGTLPRIFTMYQSSPFQYRKQMEVALRAYASAGKEHGWNSKQAKMKGKEVVKRFMIYHVALPMLFSLASAAFYPPLDDEGELDWNTLFGQAAVGSFTGTPYLGPIGRIFWDKFFMDKNYSASISPLTAAVDEGFRAVERVAKIGGDYVDGRGVTWTTKDLVDVMSAGGSMLGVPVKPVDRLIENWDKGALLKEIHESLPGSDYGIDFDTRQKITMGIGFSEYAVPQLKATGTGGGKKQWKKDVKYSR